MTDSNPQALAAELRARALGAAADEQADLLFLAAEYEQLGTSDIDGGSVIAFLPK